MTDHPTGYRVMISPIAWREMCALGFIPGDENPIAWFRVQARECARLRADLDRARDLLAAERGERGREGWTADLRGGVTTWMRGEVEVIPWRVDGKRCWRIGTPATKPTDPYVTYGYALEAMEAADAAAGTKEAP